MSTTIEWTDHTLNPGIYGCTEISPACANCYAATMAHRLSAMGVYPAGITEKKAGGIGWSGKVTVDFDRIEKAFAKLPKRKAARVFVTSMSDLFHEDVPFDFIERVFAEMAARPHLTFQVLTKRPMWMYGWWRWFASECEERGVGAVWPPNVWAGCTVEDQKRADERIPHLLRVPAKVRFLSCEPMVGAVDLTRVRYTESGRTCQIDALHGAWTDGKTSEAADGAIHWVIAGGESGPKARPSSPAWFRSLRDQCEEAGVPFFFKQWGAMSPRLIGDGSDLNAFVMAKKTDPKTLDGVEHRAFPEGT